MHLRVNREVNSKAFYRNVVEGLASTINDCNFLIDLRVSSGSHFISKALSFSCDCINEIATHQMS